MKYLKTFESLNTYQVEVLTSSQFQNLYNEIYPYSWDNVFSLKNKIHYFSWDNFLSGSDKHNKSLRSITAYNRIDIIGICIIAYWDGNDHYSISYLSTNEDYMDKGVSKRILDETFKYFSKTYPNETLYFSGYSIDGWKYLRKTILELSNKYHVKKEKRLLNM